MTTVSRIHARASSPISDDQMRVPQIRFFRYSGEAGRFVRAPPQHYQREDLRLPLVRFRRHFLRAIKKTPLRFHRPLFSGKPTRGLVVY